MSEPWTFDDDDPTPEPVPEVEVEVEAPAAADFPHSGRVDMVVLVRHNGLRRGQRIEVSVEQAQTLIRAGLARRRDG